MVKGTNHACGACRAFKVPKRDRALPRLRLPQSARRQREAWRRDNRLGVNPLASYMDATCLNRVGRCRDHLNATDLNPRAVALDACVTGCDRERARQVAGSSVRCNQHWTDARLG